MLIIYFFDGIGQDNLFKDKNVCMFAVSHNYSNKVIKSTKIITKMIEKSFEERRSYIRDNKRYWNKYLIIDRLKTLGIDCGWSNVVNVIYPKENPNKNLKIISAIEDVIKLGKQVLEPNPIGLKTKRELWVEMKEEEIDFILNNKQVA